MKTSQLISEDITTPLPIEHIQPKQCCIHPHEGCTPSADFIQYTQQSHEKKEFRLNKISELNTHHINSK